MDWFPYDCGLSNERVIESQDIDLEVHSQASKKSKVEFFAETVNSFIYFR